ncbi:DUF4192 domain-containing protein [Microbacterium sp. cx-55]|uniref:DUF4192 family protein n=1 Tax=Microbacterium sp. cx-55 TaxID=2875948 RepID=UPI001CBCCCBA|nr:DUF4192 family protein [Microbacterium sp. cx-55]MBZ4487435.1 DUF4192 domain-containing protein [Microbacterium sp. cx-55]UGB35455.1 DUF4192 domain-containing protein [Microbacterium sp. cx-55]
MTTIIKAADAADLLTMVPHLLGFAPSRSVVLIPFSGGRSAGGMRFDLPPGDTDPAAFASTVLGLACRVSLVDAIVAIVYGDEAIDADVPRRAVADAIERAAHRSGLDVIDLLYVGPDSWTRYLGDAHPPGGHALTALPAPPAAATAATGTPHPDHLSGAELPAVDLASRERVGQALRQLEFALGVVAGAPAPASGERVDPLAFSAVSALDDLPVFFELALEHETDETNVFGLATLIWCLSRPALRDVGITTWIDGVDAGDRAFEAQLRWENGAQYPSGPAERMMGEGERPDADRLADALAVARWAAAVAPRDVRPGALSVCGWLSWALGRSSHAEHYALAACEIDPEHGLSRIVLSMVQAGHLPDWAFRPARR